MISLWQPPRSGLISDLTASLPPLWAFSRASSGTQVQSGVLSTVGTNVARFETSPDGYLNEPQRTNLLLQSSTLTNASWTKSGLAITTSGTAPDGVASSANLATEDTSLAAHYVSGTGFATTASTTYVVSAFIKAGTQRYVSVRGEASGLIATYPWITLDTTLGTIDANALALTPTVLAVSNGFYLVSFTFVAFGIASGGNIVFAGSNVSTAPVAASVNGASYTGTSLTWSAWGAMLAASAFPTSLIQTTTAAATRAADNLTLDLTQLPNLQTPTGYSCAIEFSLLSNSQSQVVFGMSGSGGFSNTWYFSENGAGGVFLTTIVATVGQVSGTTALRAAGLTNRLALTVTPTGITYNLNGAGDVTVANAGMPVMTTLAVLRAPWGAGNYEAGHATLVTLIPGPQSAAWRAAMAY